MSRIRTYPITPRFPYRVYCQAIANQTAPTDMTLASAIPAIVDLATAAVPGMLELPEDANNLELRFFAYDSGSTNPENDNSTFQIFGYTGIITPSSVLRGQMLVDVAVVYGALNYTVNPYSGVTTGDWAEGDAFTFTTYRGAVAGGNTVNDVGCPLILDVRGLQYIYVVCDDLAVTGTNVEQIMVLGRSF